MLNLMLSSAYFYTHDMTYGVCVSAFYVGLAVSPAKTAEPIEMPLWM